MAIDWKEFDRDLEGAFMKLGIDAPEEVVLTNWRMEEKFDKVQLTFDVLERDGAPLTTAQTLQRSAAGFKAALKPMMQKAEAEGRDKFKVKLLRTGEGKDTKYEATEIQ